MEFLIPLSESLLRPGLNGLSELVEEALDRHINDAESGMYSGGIVRYAIENVRLAQTR